MRWRGNSVGSTCPASEPARFMPRKYSEIHSGPSRSFSGVSETSRLTVRRERQREQCILDEPPYNVHDSVTVPAIEARFNQINAAWGNMPVGEPQHH